MEVKWPQTTTPPNTDDDGECGLVWLSEIAKFGAGRMQLFGCRVLPVEHLRTSGAEGCVDADVFAPMT